MVQTPFKAFGLFAPLFSDEGVAMAGRPGQLASDLIDGRIEIHDRNQFEVKLDYALDPSRPRNRYRVEAFIFSPASLGITPHTYRKQQFYNDMQAYIRFKTPSVSLATLLLSDATISPLSRLTEVVASLIKHPREHLALDRIGDDMRLVGCLIRSHVRDQVTLTMELILGLGEAPEEEARSVEDIRNGTLRMVQELDAVLHRFRDLRTPLLDPAVPARLRETQEFVDEYVSMTVESLLTRLLQVLDESPHGQRLFAETRSRIRVCILREQAHRTHAGYLSLVHTDGGMNYVFRRGLLKKFVMSVLFLEIRKDKEGDRLSDILAAIAAGISMLVASLGGLWVQERFLASTWPFVATVVLLYMVKDRLKEWLRTFFSRKMTRFLADYSIRIRDARSGLDIGRCREAFGFLRQDQIPPAVLALRHREAHASIEATSKPEVVIKYEKEITLDGQVARKLGGLHQEISDIIRFNVSQFLLRADDPIAPVLVYDPERDRVQETACPKVYHLNVVFVLRAEDEKRPPTMEHVRVVIDKRGIRALEHRT